MKYAVVVEEHIGEETSNRVILFNDENKAKLTMIRLIDQFIIDNENTEETIYFGYGYLCVTKSGDGIDIAMYETEKGE